MCYFLAGGVISTLSGIVVLLPGAVERRQINFFRMLGQIITHAVGQIGQSFVGHNSTSLTELASLAATCIMFAIAWYGKQHSNNINERIEPIVTSIQEE